MTKEQLTVIDFFKTYSFLFNSSVDRKYVLYYIIVHHPKMNMEAVVEIMQALERELVLR